MKRAALLAALLACSAFTSAHAEVMTERCSHEVAIVGWGKTPDSNGAVLLKRQGGKTSWTPPFTVKLSDDGHIRWWCHSTTGNALDAGTWRIRNVDTGSGCKLRSDAPAEDCSTIVSFSVTTSDWKGWTAERSRCSNRSNKIRARLEGNRKLRIQCLPR